eukprot:scaffold115453_cov13-Tisochrysis_lutea.AAC.1
MPLLLDAVLGDSATGMEVSICAASGCSVGKKSYRIVLDALQGKRSRVLLDPPQGKCSRVLLDVLQGKRFHVLLDVLQGKRSR